MKKLLRKYFIPHKHNNFKPHMLQKAAVSGMFLLILLSFALANINALFITGSEWLSSAVLPSVIADLTNEEREDESAGLLVRNAVLDEAATLKAEHMAEHEYFAHNSPDGLTPWHWFRLVEYDYQVAGENLAVHFTDSQEVVDAWMESPGHRANILNTRFTEIGIGTAKGRFQGSPTIFVVQMFGSPRVVTKPVPETVVAAQETEVPVPAPITTETVEAPAPEPLLTETNVETTEVPVEESSTELYTEVTAPAPETTLEDSAPVAVPATVRPESSQLQRLITQPTVWLQMFYVALALVVSTALILSIVIEWRRQHPVQIAYGTGLLAALALMFYAHTLLTSGVLIA